MNVGMCFDRSLPAPFVVEVAERLEGADVEDWGGMLVRNPKDAAEWGIFYNGKASPERRRFTIAGPGITEGPARDPRLWGRARQADCALTEPRSNRAWEAIARLNRGIDLKQAQSRVSAINAQLDKQFHQTNKGWDVSLWTLHERLVREVKPSLLALLGAVGLVLLIACANVANLLLARSAARQKEIAIRAAMGLAESRTSRLLVSASACCGTML